MDRILVIRGGAIGDFILTLPALNALRDSMPHAHIEILGYKHIAVLAENRFYAQAVQSIEYAPLAKFFASNSELPAELADYFESLTQPVVGIHPGSGSRQKNWPVENWIAAMSKGGEFSNTGKRPSLVVIAGEADTAETERLEREWRHRNVCFAKNLPLPHLAGV